MQLVRLSDTDRLRLAIAVSILRSKPRDVSISAYVLDLYVHFPPSGPAPPAANYCWRTYALQLERDLAQLRGNWEALRAELLATRASSDLAPRVCANSVTPIPRTNADIISVKSSKRKNAKASKAPGSDVTNQSPHLDPPSTTLPPFEIRLTPCDDPEENDYFPRQNGLLLALRAFEQAANEKENGSTLLHATLNSLRVVSAMLGSTLDKQPIAEATGHIHTLGHVLYLIITSSLRSTAVSRELDIDDRLELSTVDKIFDCLIDDIFGPVIRTFKRISISLLSNSLSGISLPTSDGAEKPPRDTHLVDLRPDLLRLFQTLVSSLRFAPSAQGSSNREGSRIHSASSRRAISLSSVKASLILEVIRELRRVLFPAAHENLSGCKGSDTEPEIGDETYRGPALSGVGSGLPGSSELHDRVERLIAKDTLWYLCSLMHILADLPVPANPVKLYSDVAPRADTGRSTFISPREGNVMKDQDGTVLLELLHETIMSALYDLVLRCQPAVSQLQWGIDPSPAHGCNTPQPIENKHASSSFDTVEGVSGFQPMGEKHIATISFNAGVLSLAHGTREAERDSQAQGHTSAILAQESGFGDPGGRDQYNLPTLAGGSHCQVGCQVSAANQGRIGEVTTIEGAALSNTQPELGMYSSDVAGCETECVIDEAGFTMLLGVVERYILDPEYTS